MSSDRLKNSQSTKVQMDKILLELSQGTVLHKVKSGGILYPRRFSVDPKNMVLKYTGSEKRLRRRKTQWQLTKVREVREGEKDYSKRLDEYDRARCFCVVFGANNKVLYLLADSTQTRDRWLRGLKYALQLDEYMDQKHHTDRWIRQAFDMADKNKDGSLDFEEVMKLLKTLNADMDRSHVKILFDKADTNHQKGQKPSLDREEFVKFYYLLTERPEIEEIFKKYASGDQGYMSAQDLKVFLVSCQRQQDLTDEDCQEFISVYEPQEDLKNNDQMSLVGFRNFMMCQEMLIFNPDHSAVYQDMTKPMTHYFINSSHNTYLAEDQLKGPSKVECYITSLTQGCRCVELDCWDGPDSEPVIYHGYTLTSKINFRDVIGAVRDYAFKSSPYPVTLSIENHCSMPQQTVMAEYVRNILGDMVYAPKSMPDLAPSPHDLRGKIILKGKKLPPVVSHGDESEVSDEDEAADLEPDPHQKHSKKKKLKLSPQFSAIVGMKSQGFSGVSQCLASGPSYVIYSIVEGKIEKLIASDMPGLNKLTREKLLRIYPAGGRTDSSNYNPVPSWNAGCQVVALNFQTGSEPMQLLHGRFLDNGGSGYVLKPKCLMSDDGFKIVTGEAPSPTRKCMTVTVISGYQIPKPKDTKKGEVIDPFIKIEVYGTQRDTQEVRTSVIKNNGFNPIWRESCSFNVDVPELAIVRFAVFDQDKIADDFIGYFALPFNSIQQGYRHIPMHNKNGVKYPRAVIFVHIDISSVA